MCGWSLRSLGRGTLRVDGSVENDMDVGQPADQVRRESLTTS